MSSDPFDVMRIVAEPMAPRPAFATRLRSQLINEMEATMPAQPTTPARTIATLVPYLTVRGAAAALDFYRDAFGAVEDHRISGDGGRIGHAEFRIGDAKFALADEYPEIDVLGPESRGGPTCTFQLYVPDADASYARALQHGATVGREPTDQFHGNRTADVVDPFGHRWTFLTPIGTMTTAEYDAAVTAGGLYTIQRPAAAPPADHGGAHQLKHYDQGDLYYFTMQVPDVARAKEFFGAVLGWRFDDPQAGHVSNIAAPPGGVRDAADATDVQLWFVVDDVPAAIERVRAAGGTASEPIGYDSGMSADCVDDQGTRFSISVPADIYRR